MKLEKFYSLRNNFVIIGITGRSGSGCSQVSKILSNPNFIKELKYDSSQKLLHAEEIKFDLCYRYLKASNNFSPYKIINYKNVLLLHLIFESQKKNIEETVERIIEIICQYGDGYGGYENRFGNEEDSSFLAELKKFLLENENIINFLNPNEHIKIENWLKKVTINEFSDFYTNDFEGFANTFFEIMNRYDVTKRSRLTHDIAINLRECGNCYQVPKLSEITDLNYIYTIAESINQIIKIIRKANNGKIKVAIDSLKNSLELMYFKEKYSSFYMIAINKSEEERTNYVKDVILKTYGPGAEIHSQELLKLDKTEYKGDAVNSGDFTAPDIENCIQKSDYHIFHSKESEISDSNKYINLSYQLVKLLALIGQPGIITPTPIERTMQVAFNAKYNSGCISRQVGAVVTDNNYSIKAIGWNDVAQNQMPCKLRNAEHFAKPKNLVPEIYSEYELIGGEFERDGKPVTFSELFREDLHKAQLTDLEGRNCSFCFKAFENAYENEKNQVHTRSLHAEENAMLQIAKNGGMGLKNGFLFTTASPCELCAKKAFQLGITKIFYIDPYPGISRMHTLKNGVNGQGNPELEMFRGAVGRTFHKLYEPFLSHKDEIKILTGFKPSKIT